VRTTSWAIIARIHEACGLDASYARVINGWETSVRANSFWEEFPFRTVRVIRDGSGELLSSVVTDLPSTGSLTKWAPKQHPGRTLCDRSLPGRLREKGV